MFINSVLTVEERTLLQSIGCRNKEQVLDVLEDIEMSLPVQSELFHTAASLAGRLKSGEIDFFYEMRENIPDDEEQDIE